MVGPPGCPPPIREVEKGDPIPLGRVVENTRMHLSADTMTALRCWGPSLIISLGPQAASPPRSENGRTGHAAEVAFEPGSF